jgi:TolB-like protein/DNA-binding winged helix-turn-helix (wHTH) protein
MSSAVKHLYEFGPYQLDPSEHLLRRDHERLDLPPRVFDTLVVFVESEGRLLEKDQLMDRIWPDAEVEESNLTQAIHLLRKTLQDGENGHRYIETVPKRGYRFVAPVRDAARESGPQSIVPIASVPEPMIPPQAIPFDESPSPGHRSLWIVAAIVIALLACLGASVVVNRILRSHYSSRPIRSIAVLPLQNLSNDQDQEYFTDGMTDELITGLAQVRELKVVSRTSVMQYKGTRKPLPQIGRELGVDAVVEGSVLRSGDRVRITTQLIRASDDRHLWAQSYEGDLRNVLSLQAHVAEAITNEVRLTLDSSVQSRLHAPRNYDPEAYDLYLHGRYAFRRRNPEGFHEAMGYYEQAATKDPNFALAYTGLADCYTLLALFGDGYRWVPDAMSNARHALALDETLAEAHTSLAAAYVLDWKWAEAEKEFHRTLELNPNDAQAHQWYGNLYLGPTGRHAEAIAELKRALDLDPLSLVINTDLGYAYYLDGSYDAALHQYNKVVEMDPNFLPVHYDLMLTYRQRGMHNEEMNELIKDENLAGRTAAANEIQELVHQPEKLYEKMAQTGGRFGEAQANSTFSPASAAEAYTALGRKDLALEFLQKSVDARETEMIYIKVDPTWARLSTEPKFQELVRRVGLTP